MQNAERLPRRSKKASSATVQSETARGRNILLSIASRAAASEPGMKCPYRRNVNAGLEWPRYRASSRIETRSAKPVESNVPAVLNT
jgi:hypothetical protein